MSVSVAALTTSPSVWSWVLMPFCVTQVRAASYFFAPSRSQKMSRSWGRAEVPVFFSKTRIEKNQFPMEIGWVVEVGLAPSRMKDSSHR